MLTSHLEPASKLTPAEPNRPDRLETSLAAFPPEAEPELARASLLPERAARHVLSAALTTKRPGGDLDLSQLIDAVCRLEPLHKLPRQSEPTLDHGVQLLLDYSDAMLPFWRDLNQLTEQVREVVGAHTTQVYRFDGQPTQARDWTASYEPQPWRPDGRPVLAATDLGSHGEETTEPRSDWVKLAKDCARAGSPLILLNPWPEHYWPKTLPPNAILIHWGARTTAGMVRQAIKSTAAQC
ncbi:hypothetical protein L0E83_03175 [Marichromatium gracile]|uniref:hypothetical protein n=1 Tax=Marichromatium gracile TaxID=1048 RepID=UPI001F3342B7|nr:hypothetical protein [Marichromatium gracile]MCF1182438.1 hypothetical protein [Marichromatium gracile]